MFAVQVWRHLLGRYKNHTLSAQTFCHHDLFYQNRGLRVHPFLYVPVEYGYVVDKSARARGHVDHGVDLGRRYGSFYPALRSRHALELHHCLDRMILIRGEVDRNKLILRKEDHLVSFVVHD